MSVLKLKDKTGEGEGEVGAGLDCFDLYSS